MAVVYLYLGIIKKVVGSNLDRDLLEKRLK